ncbi:MAG: hypothetical protein J7K87_04040 [Candidatus Aenigmarchaeota archaeon]|nr:hypothetical protein [Candidatus Aenigmarchaeota archaeon]
MKLKESFKWDTKANKTESISFITLIIAAVLTIIGISVGSFIPGIPVLLAIIGAFLVLVGIVIYIISEIIRIFEKK